MKLKSVLLVLISILLFYCHTAGATSTSDSTPGNTPNADLANESSAVDWWPMFQHDAAHTGFSFSEVPKTNETLWVSGIGETASVGFAPAVVEGRVFVGSTRDFWCINSSSGLTLWNFRKPLDPSTSPVVSNGKVIISGGQEELFCLDVTNGNSIWNFTAGSYVRSSPVIKDGRVFVGSWGNGLYCINETNGLLIWNVEGSSVTSPMVAENLVFTLRGNNLVSLYVESGTQLWASPLGGKFGRSSPAFYEGKVFVGTSYGNNTLYCHSSDTGELTWKYETEGWIEATPAVANGKVFIGDRGNTGRIYCLNAQNGSLVWKRSYEGEFGAEYSSPVVADGKVVLCMGRKLYVLNEMNGDVIWSYEPPIVGYDVNRSPGFTGSSVAIAEGRIYVVSEEGSLYCFGPMLYYTITIDPEFLDNQGEPFSPQPSSCTFRFSNRTEKTTSIPVSFYVPMGPFALINVVWRDTEVLKQEVSMYLDSDTRWEPQVNCMLPTDLEIGLSCATPLIGFKVEITGNATCNELGLVDIPILLSYSVTKGESWNDITLVQSGTDGNFSAIWMPSATGDYIVKANWAGNSTFPGTTATVNLAVIAFEEENVFSVTSNSTISALAFNSTSRELSFSVTGPSGTIGYVNVYIAKTLVENVTDIKVYLNGERLNHTATSLDDSWRIRFIYLHSTHKITINLGRISAPFVETLLVQTVILTAVCIAAIVVLVLVILKKRFKSNEKEPVTVARS